MAQSERSQQAGYPKNNDTGNELSTEQSSIRSSLRSRFAVNNTVLADDVNNLRTLMNAFQRHYHRYTDYDRIQTYGNNGSTGSRNVDTSILTGYSDPGTVSAGDTISASYINGHVNAANTLRNHNHAIDDA
jgi:hypothetical protein